MNGGRVPDPGDVAALYRVLPEEFVAVRDRLAKDLRAHGERSEAQRVAKLRRPPPSAWALNQVAKTDPGLVRTLLVAGARLRDATSAAMSGDASGLRGAEAAERSAVDAVVSSAAASAHAAGRPLTDGQRQRMITTLRAAVLDDAVATCLERGTLDADHEAPAFGFGPTPEGGEAAGPRPTRADAGNAARARARRAEVTRLHTQVERLEQRALRLAREAADAERRAADLRAQADAAGRDAAAAKERFAAAQPETGEPPH